jgi:hypothetical protein
VAVAITDLETVLQYQNEEVLARFTADHRCSRALAESLFLELKRWLWLCAQHASEGRPGCELTMSDEMASIDLMWHTFLLFTHDYQNFCTKYFGHFIHHQPTSQAVKNTMTPEKRLAQLKANYEYIYDHLGADILRRWCEELPTFSEAPLSPVPSEL